MRLNTKTDVEKIGIDGAKAAGGKNLELEKSESDDENDDNLMGFHFSNDEVLIDRNGEPFQFRRYKSLAKNQQRYEKLGEKVTEYIYHLLETRCKLKRIFVPIDAEPGEEQSFIFVSENAFETEDKLIIYIHGSGVVRAGQWARSLIINDSLKSGSQIPFIEESLRRGYEVIVLNTNYNSAPSGELIRGSEDPESHAIYVWENLVEKNVKAKNIAIVAHSYGGCLTKELVARKYDQVFSRVFAVAFTDSVHSLSAAHDPPKVIEFFRKRARNWVRSSLPLDEPIKDSGSQRLNDAPRFSAGHEKHEWTSWSSFAAVFKFLDESYQRLQLHKSKL